MKTDSEFLTFIANSKLKLFNVVYMVLKRQRYPLSLALLISVVQLAQLIYFPFQEHLRYIWRNDFLSSWINFILEFFTLMKYVENKPYNTYLVVFYLCVALVHITCILLFAQYLLANANFSNQIPVQIARITIIFLMTFAFEPILRILLGFMACSDASGTFMMIYTTHACWQGDYIIHVSVAIFTLIVLILLVSILTQICIESKDCEYNALAMREGHSFMYYYSFIVASLISYSTFEKPRYSLLIILIQFGFSYKLFYNVQRYKPFYNQKTQKLWSVISGINAWTELMIVYSYFLEGFFIEKTLQIWTIGIPFIMAILLKRSFFEVDLMKICLTKTSSGIEVVQICEFIMELTQQSNKCQRALLLLEGYIEFHKQTCNKLECAVQINKKLQKKHKYIEKYKEKGYMIKELVNELFMEGVILFPNCVTLRISYAYFLLDKMNGKQQALNQLYIAETCDPSFDEQFFIYRYQRIIEEKIQKQYQKHDGQKLNIMTEKIIQQEMHQLQTLMEDSSMNHMFFWSQLQEQTPDLGFLQEYGEKIIVSVERVEKQFNKILEIDPNNTIIHRQISKFYELVIHDEKESFDQLYEMIRKQKQQKKELQIFDNISFNSDALIVMTLKPGERRTILNVNKSTCSMLGFTKTDLISRPLETILPQIYIDYNTQLNEYFFEQQQLEINQINQFPERTLMLKQKSNYIIPLYSQSQVMNSINGFVMTSRLRQETYSKPRCHLLLDLQGKIQDITSQCQVFLNLTHQTLSQRKEYITGYFPELLVNRDNYINRQSIITYDPIQSTSRKSLSEIHINQLKYQQFLCSLSVIETPYVQQNDPLYQIFGYVMKLELYTTQQITYPILVKKKQMKKVFKFQTETKTYILKDNDLPASQNESVFDKSILWEEPQRLYLFAQSSNHSSKKSQSKHHLFAPNKNQIYDDDIRTLRLFNNKIQEIEEVSVDEDEYSISKNKQNEEDDEKKIENEEFNLSLKNRKELVSILKNSTIPIIMLKFVIIINLLFVILIIVSFVMFVLIDETVANISTALSLLSINNLRFAAILEIQTSLQDLRFVNEDISPFAQTFLNGTLEQVIRSDLKYEIEKLSLYQNQLLANKVTLSASFSEYEKRLQEQKISMESLDGQSQSYQLNDVVQQLLSMAITMNSSSLEQFSDSNQQYYYYNHNVLNSISTYSIIPQDYYYYYIFSLTEYLHELYTYFTIAQFILLFVTLIIVLIFFNEHSCILKEILKLFLEIEEQKIHSFVQSTQTFMSKLSGIANDQNDSDEENRQEIMDGDQYQMKKQKKKHLPFQRKERNFLFIKTLLITSIFAFFFTYDLTSINIISSDTNALAPLLNITSNVACIYRMLDNALVETFWNSETQIMNENSSNALNQLLISVQELEADVYIYNQENANVVDTEYNTAFNNIYIYNPCSYLNYSTDAGLLQCTKFGDGILKQGLSLGITKLIESMRYLLTEFNAYNESREYRLTYNLSNNPRKNYAYNLLNSDMNIFCRTMTKLYVELSHQYLIDKLQGTLNLHYDSIMLQVIIMFICFCVYFFMIYFFSWMPRIQDQQRQVYLNRVMLSFIPLDTIEQIPQIKQYIRTWINHE